MALPRWFSPRLVPPLALMGVIFFLSHQPDLSSGLGTIDLVGRKFVHAAIFGLLCFLWWRALRSSIQTSGQALSVAVAISYAYAISDEFHQSFIEGRHASAFDVAIDWVGITAAAAWIRRSRA